MRNLPDALAGAQVGITLATLLLGFVAEPAVAGIIENMHRLAADPLRCHAHDLPGGRVAARRFPAHGDRRNGAEERRYRHPREVGSVARGSLSMVYDAVSPADRHSQLGWPTSFLRIFGVETRDKLETAHTAEDLAVGDCGRAPGGDHRGIRQQAPFGRHPVLGTRCLRGDGSPARHNRPSFRVDPGRVRSRSINEEGFSRIPIYGSNIDDLTGFVHAKDLLGVSDEDRDRPIDPALIRPLLAVPETASIRLLLNEMQRSGRHLALIVDEHGGTAGLLTLEDIAEELVGDIRDEYDEGETAPRQLTGRDRYEVPGAIRPDELRSLTGLKLPAGEYETLGGFVMDRLGRIARRGDKVDVDNWIILVKKMDGRRVTEIELQKF